MKKSLIADAALLLVALNWGLNFVIQKNVLVRISPSMYTGIRFILSSIIIAVLFYKRLKHISAVDIKGGLIVGLFSLLGYLIQAIGLLYTTPSKSGFITGSNVVMVPFFSYFLTKKFPGFSQVIGAVITFVGLGFISLTENLTIEMGDVLTLLCAVFFALQILSIEYYVKKADPFNMAFIQTVVIGAASFIFAIINGDQLQGYDINIWLAIIYAAIFCTAGAFVIQNVAQKHTTSVHTAIILSTESVFAGIFSFLLWGELLTYKTLIGFSMVLSGVLIAELTPKTSEGKKGLGMG